jgi:predicted ATPase
MLTKVQIKNFRCFRELEIAPLRRVNLITGQNNTGKTALLEALSLLLAQPNPSAQGNLPNTFRAGFGNADPQENFWNWLFPAKNLELAMELKCELNGGEKIGWLVQKEQPGVGKKYSGQLVEAGQLAGASCFGIGPGSGNAAMKAIHFSTRPSDPSQDAVDFNRVVVKRRKKELVGLLQPLERRLEGLEALQLGRPGCGQVGPLIYAEIQGLPEMIPVTQLGQGFSRLLDIYSEILARDAQVLLVDEIENGIHHSVLPVVWKGLFHAAEEAGVQIFATTHSWECILAADKAARENGSYDLSLIRLDRVEGDVKATVMDDQTLAKAKELHWELR